MEATTKKQKSPQAKEPDGWLRHQETRNMLHWTCLTGPEDFFSKGPGDVPLVGGVVDLGLRQVTRWV